jgi:hypothetical protein
MVVIRDKKPHSGTHIVVYYHGWRMYAHHETKLKYQAGASSKPRGFQSKPFYVYLIGTHEH